MSSLDNKRIVKNTFALYFRQIVTMGVSLYTSRVVLNELGVTDFGINAVVGGLVTICGFISGALSQTLNRYFSFELGKKDYDKLNKIFSIALVLYTIVAAISVILAETAGLWFLQNKMVVPPERASAALWVYEFSVLGMVLAFINAPYISMVISREKFKVFAYMSIFDVVMKLAIVYSLVAVNFDKLKLFSVLNFAVGCLVFIIYQKYCRSNFAETTFRFCKEWSLYKDMLKFSGWIFLNPISYAAKYQGVPIVFNLFFGPAVNAAHGIADKVVQAINSFITNAFLAVNPQIIKLYAEKNYADMWNLVIRASKMYYLLFFILMLPVIANTKFILGLWLGSVPNYAAVFTQLILIEQLIRVLMLASVQVNNASGNIKALQITGCIAQSSNLPTAIVLCYLGFNPEAVFVAGIAIMMLNTFLNCLVVKIQNGLPAFRFLRELFLPIGIVTALSITAPLAMHHFLPNETLFSLLNIAVCVAVACVVSFCFGLSKGEREKVAGFVVSKIRH